MASSSLLPRLVLVTAIILTAGAGVKNYLNKEAIKTEREAAKTQVDASQARIQKAADEAKAAKADCEKLKAELAAKGTNDGTGASAGDVAAAKTAAEQAQAQVQAKNTEIDDLKKKLAEASSAKPAQDPAMEAKVAEAVKAAAEKDQIAKTLQAKAEEAEHKAAALEAENTRRAAGLAKPGLEGKVLAVNPAWNFVVLNIGDKQGVVAGAALIVKRGGNMVAKLRVSSVEPSTSIADIQGAGTGRSFTVQAGDVVIFPGS